MVLALKHYVNEYEKTISHSKILKTLQITIDFFNNTLTGLSNPEYEKKA